MQSGLRTVKRDWSSNEASSSSSSTAETQPPNSASVATDMSPRSKRLAAIQAGLDSVGYQSQALKTSTIINSSTASTVQMAIMNRVNSSSSSSSKRSSPDNVQQGDNTTAKKRRVLPDSFTKEEGRKDESVRVSKAPSSAKTSDTLSERTNMVKKEKPRAAEKPAPIFLSKEQVRILELVQKGQSLFYTGSAGVSVSINIFFVDDTMIGTGKSVLLREIIKTMRKRYATAPDAVAITASTGS